MIYRNLRALWELYEDLDKLIPTILPFRSKMELAGIKAELRAIIRILEANIGFDEAEAKGEEWARETVGDWYEPVPLEE